MIIILIMHPDNPTAGKESGLRHWFKFLTGARYLGGFIGDDESKCEWLKYWTSKWEKKIARSPKWWGNIPRRVMPQWFVQSNWNGYFCNV